MVVQIKVSKETLRFLKHLDRISEKNELYEILVKFFDKKSKIIAGNVTRNFLSGQRLARRTGNLARSVIGRGELLEGLPALRIGIFRGPALSYAAVQEHGTVGKGGSLPSIIPKQAKALAIPQKPALTRAGVNKFGGPRDAPVDLTFIPFRNSGVAVGGLFETETLLGVSRLDEAKLWYILVSRVDIKPKHYLRDGMLKSLTPLSNTLGKFLRDLLAAKKQGSSFSIAGLIKKN